jgi:hypothetical protein
MGACGVYGQAPGGKPRPYEHGEESIMAIFRIERTKDYTVMSKQLLRMIQLGGELAYHVKHGVSLHRRLHGQMPSYKKALYRTSVRLNGGLT